MQEQINLAAKIIFYTVALFVAFRMIKELVSMKMLSNTLEKKLEYDHDAIKKIPVCDTLPLSLFLKVYWHDVDPHEVPQGRDFIITEFIITSMNLLSGKNFVFILMMPGREDLALSLSPYETTRNLFHIKLPAPFTLKGGSLFKMSICEPEYKTERLVFGSIINKKEFQSFDITLVGTELRYL